MIVASWASRESRTTVSDVLPRSPTLAIGSSNTAGQATAVARAVRSTLGVDAFSFATWRPPGVNMDGATDFRLPHHRIRPLLIRRTVALRVLRHSTHVLSESLGSPLGDSRTSSLADDADDLLERGLSLACLFHGSDIRSPSRHMSRIPDSYFRLGSANWREDLETTTGRRRHLAQSMGIPIFVTTPDLLLDLPEATWMPVVIDPGQWESTSPPDLRRRPRVLHLPSRRVPPIKGSDVIDPVLRELNESGAIDYVSPGHVDFHRMPELVRRADVVVDQVRSGSFGVATCEAMAAGRVVVSALASDVADAIDATGMPLPPFEASTSIDFAETMHRILDSPEAALARAALGPDYVRHVHDGRQSAVVLGPFLGIHDVQRY